MSSIADARGDEIANDAIKPAPAEEAARYHQNDLHNVFDEISENAQKIVREIKFSMDEKSNRVLIKITDQVTKEVIRDIPPEAVINMAHQLDQLKGVWIKEKD